MTVAAKASQGSNGTKLARAEVKTIDVSGCGRLEVYWTGDLQLFEKKIRGNSRRRCLLYDTSGYPYLVVPKEKKIGLLKVLKIKEQQFERGFGDFKISITQEELTLGEYLVTQLTSGQANHLSRLGTDKPARKIIPVTSPY